MTAERARGMDVEVEFTLTTPEEFPLAVFGKNVGEATSERLEAAGFSSTAGLRPWCRGRSVWSYSRRRSSASRIG